MTLPPANRQDEIDLFIPALLNSGIDQVSSRIGFHAPSSNTSTPAPSNERMTFPCKPFLVMLFLPVMQKHPGGMFLTSSPTWIPFPAEIKFRGLIINTAKHSRFFLQLKWGD